VEAAVKGTYDTFAKSRNLAVAQAKAVRLIRREISLATIRGDNYEKLASRIGKAIGCNVVGGKVRYGRCGAAAWSMEVARTEGQRVLVEGQTAAYDRARELGCDIEIVWDATLDARTRPAHGALDGKVQDDPEKGWWVESLGKYVSAPLHSGVAAFDVNCRCRKRAQVKGFPPDERYVRGDGVVPYQTYQEWKDKITGTFYTIDVTTPDGTAVTSLSEHIKFRMNGRSLTKVDIIDAFANPLEIEQKIRYNEQGQPSKRYIGAKATVNVNPVTGVATTAWRTGSKTVDKIRRKRK